MVIIPSVDGSCKKPVFSQVSESKCVLTWTALIQVFWWRMQGKGVVENVEKISWGGFYTAFIQSGIIVSMHSGEKSDKCGENILRCCFLAWASSQSATYKMIDHLLTPFSPELTIISVFPAGRPNCKQITKCTKLGIWERCTHGVGVHGSLPRALFTRQNVQILPKIYSRQDIAQMKSTEA